MILNQERLEIGDGDRSYLQAAQAQVRRLPQLPRRRHAPQLHRACLRRSPQKKRQSLVFHDDEGMQRGDEINQTRSPPWKTLQPSDGVTADKDTEVEEPEAHDRTRGCQTEEENQTQSILINSSCVLLFRTCTIRMT